MGSILAGLWSLISGGTLLLINLIWLVLQLGLGLALPAANYFIWKSNLKSNMKLMYVTVFSVLLLTAITVIRLTAKPKVKGLHSVFDPELAYYKPESTRNGKSVTRTVAHEMGLESCVDPDGNIIDLSKRIKSDHSWILFETPNEFLRKESVEGLATRGNYNLQHVSNPLSPLETEGRHNQIKLEDFRFLDAFLRKEKLKQSSGISGHGILYFDLDGMREEAFESIVQSIGDHQQSDRDGRSTVLFSTSDNHLSNLLSGKNV